MLAKAEQYENIEFEIVVIPLGRVTLVKEVQPLNRELPIVVIPSGIFILVKLEHP